MSENRAYWANEDEINLYEMWLIAWNRKWVVLTIAIVFVTVAAVYAYHRPTVYKVRNTLVLSSGCKDFIDASEIRNIILVLNELTPRQKAMELDISVDEAQTIESIKILDVKGPKDSLKIEIRTLNSDAGVRLMNRLPSYILARPYLNEKIETTKSLLQKNRDELEKIIADPMGSFGLKASQCLIYGPILDLYSYIEKYNQISTSISQIERKQVVVLADKTHVPELPLRTRKIYILFSGALIGIVMGLFTVFLLEAVMSAKRQHQKKVQSEHG